MFKKFFVICTLLLASCGFRPLYGDQGEIMQDAQAVQIEPVSGEGGYQFEMVLKNRLNPQKEQVQKKYQLIVSLDTPVYLNQSIRGDNFASMKKMDIKANYRLIDMKTKAVLISSYVDSNGIFNLIKDPYATVVAEDKLYENLIRMMAEDIATHVLAYFKGVPREG